MLGNFQVIGRILDQYLQGKYGRLRKITGERGLGKQPMAGRTVGIARQNLLGETRGLGRISTQRNLAPRHQRRRARAAPNFFEESGTRAHLLELSGPQRLPAVKKSRFLFENLLEKSDGVIIVLPLERRDALFVLLPQRTRDFTQALLWHGKTLGRARKKSN